MARQISDFTRGGVPSRSEVFVKLLDSLREAQDCTATIGHLDGLNGHHTKERGWHKITENLKQMEQIITKFAQGSFQ